MQEHELIDSTFAHEIAEDTVDAVLDLLLSDQAIAPTLPFTIEQLPALHDAARMADLSRAEMIEHVAQVLRRIAKLLARLAAEEREVLPERHHTPVLRERFADVVTDRAEPVDVFVGAHGCAATVFQFSVSLR